MEQQKLVIQPLLQNVVATASLSTPVNLRAIATNAKNVEYNPKKFPAAILRYVDPKATVLIFESGKMVCNGSRSEEDARYACRRATKTILKCHPEGTLHVQFKDFKIENLVASCDLKFPIRVEGLSQSCQENSTYEPEMFPGLIYRFPESKAIILVFVSGKVVITGARSAAEIEQKFREIYPKLHQFRKK
ncbi:MAG: putative TATA-box-binding protein 1 [Streblomastix strix]|uniref:Putative TATA-box-binding protein 1 n=1 Tax=Streblomastix strix TaxID=222440 RepID=A0A5J4X885_9EUKA|nr:MAG: putative TATA-box-binding protein 1 [Streblomastix strix]